VSGEALRAPVAGSRWWIVLVVTGALGCASKDDEPGPPPGSLQVEWTGADTGKLAAPAVAEWCDSLRLLQMRAIHGDTGIALVLYPLHAGMVGSRVPPGKYHVLAPDRADSSRPSAAVALRWFAETSIRGFRADSGLVTLESTAPGAVAGRFSAALRSTTEGSRVAVTGLFKGLTVTPASPDCAGRPEEPEDAGSEDEPVDEGEFADSG
jgi:hypothetical protein